MEMLLTTAETLAALRISRATLYAWMEEGKITPLRAAHLRQPRLQFRQSDIDRLLTDDRVVNWAKVAKRKAAAHAPPRSP